MNQIKELLEQRLKILAAAKARAKRDMAHFPEGSLRISSTKRQTRYYWAKEKGNSAGEYIPMAKETLVKALAQKDYNMKFLREADKEMRALEAVAGRFSGLNEDKTFGGLSPKRRELVEPYIMPDELFLRKWQDEEYKKCGYMPEKKVYATRRGEMVRSKSEALLADILCEKGIPYHYEQELVLLNGKARYPDFTLLNKRTREVLYLEHFGLLDDEMYRRDCLDKLDEYARNGIFIGKNLLITYESAEHPFNPNQVREMLEAVF